VSFAGFDAAAALHGRHPVIYDHGEETPLRTAEILTSRSVRGAVTFERVSLEGVGGFSYTDCDHFGEAWLDADVVVARLVTYRLDQEYVHAESALSLTTLAPGLDPVDVRYTRESEIGDGGPAGFAGDFYGRGWFYRDDLAPWMLFDRVYLHDPDRAAPLVDAMSFADHARLGLPDFTFELMVDATVIRPWPIAFEGDFADEAYGGEEDSSHIDRALDAVAVSKSWRDKALVTFETTRPRTWGDGLPLDGSVRLWSRVPSSL
jgi:hypothetical protein